MELGDRVVVIGLGLLGQIAVQLLAASGSHVSVLMWTPARRTRLQQRRRGDGGRGSDNSAVDRVSTWTGGEGADAVVIMASTSTNEPLEQAAAMCRERGRIVATGLVGLEIPRRTFYDKELKLIVSRAWGPGSHDPDNAGANVDQPVPYPRWTAKRNVEEFLDQLAKGAVSVQHLITHRFPIEKAAEAYEMILEGSEPCIGVVLTYLEETSAPVQDPPDQRPAPVQERSHTATVWLKEAKTSSTRRKAGIGVGVIGAGLFARGTLLPAMKRVKSLTPRGIVSNTGLNARHAGKKFGYAYCATDFRELLDDQVVDLVLVLTRHDSHAQLVIEALKSGKHVFVEKPLAMDLEQLRSVEAAYRDACDSASARGVRPPIVMVGFNRRFSPFTVWVKERFRHIAEPLSVNCVVNAGPLPADSWVNDPVEGGGRIIGEVCHFVDMVQHLTSSAPARVYAERAVEGKSKTDDSVVSTLTMVDGSIATIAYLARGDKRHSRERVEVFGGGAVGTIDNFNSASFIYNGRRHRRRNRISVDRGHLGELQALSDAITRGASPPVAFTEFVATTLATFAMERSLVSGRPEAVDPTLLAEAPSPAPE